MTAHDDRAGIPKVDSTHNVWRYHVDGSPVHVWPDGDGVEHDTETDDCVCGPTIEPVQRTDGSIGWLITHHSTDGREAAP